MQEHKKIKDINKKKNLVLNKLVKINQNNLEFFYRFKQQVTRQQVLRKKLLKKRKPRINSNFPNFKIYRFYKNRTKFRRRKRIYYFLFLKNTLNNLFSYVYNFYNTRRLKKKIIFYKINFFSSSLGITGYKGPAKNSNVAIEASGRILGIKLYRRKIRRVNLVLFSRLNRKIKNFLKGFYPLVRVKKIFFFPKFAHNGCRRKTPKRR